MELSAKEVREMALCELTSLHQTGGGMEDGLWRAN